ncbi:MAG: MFS transporter [Sterolibacterium sp.]|jgi:PPP family 3-phenylpropionic acid transporter|nr:MFS transporter [Sterolibacterium sp.]
MPHWRLATWYFLYFAFIGAYMPYFGVYLQAQGYSAWDISLLLSLMQLMRLFAPNLWSHLAERLGRQAPVVRATTALCILCFSLLFFTQGLGATFVAIALLAFFWSAALPLVEALTLSQLDRHAEHYGRIRLWGSVGFVVAVQCIGALLDALPIISLLWVSLALLGLLLGSALALPESHSPPEHGHEARPSISYRAMLQRQPKLLPLLWACFLMSAAHGPLYVFYSIHLVEHAYSKTLIGALWSLGVAAEILAFMWMPRLLRRYSLYRLLLLAFIAAVLRFLMIGWGASAIPLLILAQLLHGLTFGAFHAVMVALLHRWFPGREQTRAQALYGSISFGAGGLLGGLLSGQLWDSIGAGWTYTLGALFALGGLLIVRRYLHTPDDLGSP